MASGVGRIVVGATEHDAVRASAEATGAEVIVWPVDARGVAISTGCPDNLVGPKTLVCLMSATTRPA